MMATYNLEGVRMNVVKTAVSGVVNSKTVFELRQQGDVVSAVYSGGRVTKGFFVGALKGDRLDFRYCQIDDEGRLDGGVSTCRLSRLKDGRLSMVERFQWESRGEAGENVFEEIL